MTQLLHRGVPLLLLLALHQPNPCTDMQSIRRRAERSSLQCRAIYRSRKSELSSSPFTIWEPTIPRLRSSSTARA
uniref:Putative secreted protein n=1 Tax=Anopheles darlingi TaxID=43151 RepID=A0A2M4DCK8_ANODA